VIVENLFAITGLVPVISMQKRSASPIEMAGTDPRIKSGDGHDILDVQ